MIHVTCFSYFRMRCWPFAVCVWPFWGMTEQSLEFFEKLLLCLHANEMELSRMEGNIISFLSVEFPTPAFSAAGWSPKDKHPAWFWRWHCSVLCQFQPCGGWHPARVQECWDLPGDGVCREQPGLRHCCPVPARGLWVFPPATFLGQNSDLTQSPCSFSGG